MSKPEKQVQKPKDDRKDEIMWAVNTLGKIGIYRIAKAVGMSKSPHLETIIQEMVADEELEMFIEPWRGAYPYRRVFSVHGSLAS